MKVDINYWYGFTKWWFGAILIAATNNDLGAVKGLASGAKEVIDLLVEPLEDFPEVKKLTLSTAIDVYTWAKANKDPFKPARVRVEGVKAQYK